MLEISDDIDQWKKQKHLRKIYSNRLKFFVSLWPSQLIPLICIYIYMYVQTSKVLSLGPVSKFWLWRGQKEVVGVWRNAIQEVGFNPFSINTSFAYVQTSKLESWSCKSLLLKRTKGERERERPSLLLYRLPGELQFQFTNFLSTDSWLTNPNRVGHPHSCCTVFPAGFNFNLLLHDMLELPVN